MKKSGVAEPSDISFVKDCDEIGNGSIWIVTQEELNPKVIERTDHKQINHMIMLYCKFNRRAVYIGIAVRQIRRI